MRMAMALAIVAVLVACSGPASPTPDLVATQIAVEDAAHATMTARIPTATDTPLPAATPTATPKLVTLDGTENGEVVVPEINIWDSYNPRNRVVAVGKHGEQVQLIRRSGNGVLIQLADGTRGWVTYWFIKELK